VFARESCTFPALNAHAFPCRVGFGGLGQTIDVQAAQHRPASARARSPANRKHHFAAPECAGKPRKSTRSRSDYREDARSLPDASCRTRHYMVRLCERDHSSRIITSTSCNLTRFSSTFRAAKLVFSICGDPSRVLKPGGVARLHINGCAQDRQSLHDMGRRAHQAGEVHDFAPRTRHFVCCR